MWPELLADGQGLTPPGGMADGMGWCAGHVPPLLSHLPLTVPLVSARRLAPMRLYTLSKRHFVLVFVVFFICFGLTVFVGIKGEYPLPLLNYHATRSLLECGFLATQLQPSCQCPGAQHGGTCTCHAICFS